ncbi:hypothetical protein [Actinoplanes sp. NPDC023714]|uniref:hypothetical protein n=1 Tax=Actinoplanes sp. NPDC023714 TaxID=3154322 RepID=UPI003409B2F8
MILLALAISGCDSGDGDGDPDAAACELATPPAAGAAPDTTAVKVAEQGYTVVKADFARNATSFARVSIGAVLENTGDQVAYRTRVVFDALDASGTSVVSGEQAKYKMIEVPLLAPGEKAAIGDTLVVDEKATVDTVTIEPAVTGWLPPGDAADGLAPIPATVSPDGSGREPDGSALVAFTTESPNCTDLLSRGITFAWRDTAGKLVGGNIDGQTKQSACQVGGTTSPITAMSQKNTVPETADVTKTQVSALCDLTRGPGVVKEGEPIN